MDARATGAHLEGMIVSQSVGVEKVGCALPDQEKKKDLNCLCSYAGDSISQSFGTKKGCHGQHDLDDPYVADAALDPALCLHQAFYDHVKAQLASYPPRHPLPRSSQPCTFTLSYHAPSA